MDDLRTHLAGVFVIAGLLLPLFLLGNRLEHASPLFRIVFAMGMALLLILLCKIAFFLFNLPIGKQTPQAPRQTEEEYIQELEEQGLLVSTDFKAIQSFEVPEFEDEGLHYFLKLEDSSVLYLNGQELYGYAPAEPPEYEPGQVSHVFPCTDFTVRRHRDKDFIVDIICRGEALAPDMLESPELEDYFGDNWPRDGEILTGQAFDELKVCIMGEGN